MGNYTDGWELYEERFKTGLVPRECFPSNGPLVESFDEIFNSNKTLLIWSEQGIGDVIQFSRYLLYFLYLDIDFVFLCPHSLFHLFDKWFVEKLNVTVLPKSRLSSDDNPHIPLLSLPKLVKTSLHTIPSALPYFERQTIFLFTCVCQALQVVCRLVSSGRAIHATLSYMKRKVSHFILFTRFLMILCILI